MTYSESHVFDPAGGAADDVGAVDMELGRSATIWVEPVVAP